MALTESTSTAHPSGSAPLIIGVTGHRNIPEHAKPAIEQSVALVFKELRELAPNTPMVLLSPLSEGADRLAARVALSMGLRLIAPLPLAQAEYELDFSEPASKQEFAELLERAERSFIIDGGTELPPGVAGAARDRQYAKVGAFVVRHSHILLALWDGKPLTLHGGTAQVVQYKLQGIPEDLGESDELLDPWDIGPVYQIVTPRADGSAPVGEPYAVVRHFPGTQMGDGPDASTFARELAYVNRFNVDVANWHAAAPGNAASGSIMPAARLEHIPNSVRESLSAIEAVFRPADALAKFFERRSRSALRILFALGLPAALCLQGASQGAPLGTVFMLAFIALLSAGYCVLLGMVKKPDVQGRHLDYRALAEGLRIQYFWTLAQTNEVVSRHYLTRHQNELGWVRRALQSCEIYQGAQGPIRDKREALSDSKFADSTTDALQSEADLLRLVNENWILEQLNWFNLRTDKRQAQVLRMARMSYRLLLIGVTLAVMSPAERLRRELNADGQHHWGVVILIFVPIIPLILAMIRSASQVRQISRARRPSAGGEAPSEPGTAGSAHRSHYRPWRMMIPGLLTVAAVAMSYLLIRSWSSESGPLNVPTLFALAFILAAASFHAYAEKQGLSMHVKQYSRMAKLFSAAHRAISQALSRDDHANANRLIVALGRESLEQNESWLLLHRERPIDIHGI